MILFLALSITNLVAVFIALRRLGEAFSVSFLTAVIVAVLPWYRELLTERSWYLLFFTVPSLLIILFPKSVYTNYRKIGASLALLAFLVFLTSIFIIPQYTNVEVDFQRTQAERLKVQAISPFFSNKVIESLRYRERLFFENLDFGNYFFEGHPRERGDVKEAPKFHFLMIPFIARGLFKINKELGWFLLGWGVMSISLPVFLSDRTISSGSFLIFPVAYLTSLGILSLRLFK